MKEDQTISQQQYWTQRYLESNTAWDAGEATMPITAYCDQLHDKTIRILIPGAGNAYEASYLFENGFTNVHILDISEIPLENFKKQHPQFPVSQIHHQDFFKHKGTYDLILEQTFFCSLLPTKMNRVKYATKMASLLAPNGKLVGVWFNHPLDAENGTRPFGGTQQEYEGYLSPYFDIISFELCYNSIAPRQGNELFGIFQKKKKKNPQANNPLHGITLKTMVEQLVATYGWNGLAQMINIKSFSSNPSVKSSLTFLRKTPWARQKVEGLYLKTLRKGLLKGG